MKILVCVSGNAPGFRFEHHQVFVYEQLEAVRRLDPTVEYRVFAIVGKGVKGYLSAFEGIRRTIKEYAPDIVHAHCGQVGFIAVLQRRIPVITTFHGSDVNDRRMRPLSSIASLFSASSFFVSEKLSRTLQPKGKNSVVIPCGVDRNFFYPMDKAESKKKLGINPDCNYILFASSFDNNVKNPELALAVASHFPDYELKEIKNRSREEVAWLINGAELVLMTSHSEGSPQIIKEAVCCGQRIVSVDVGDVREQLQGLPGCRVCSSNEGELVDAVRQVLNDGDVVYQAGERFDSERIAETILNNYKSILRTYGKL